MNGKLGNEHLGEFKLGDAELETVGPRPGSGATSRLDKLLAWNDVLRPEDEIAIAFVLTRV